MGRRLERYETLSDFAWTTTGHDLLRIRRSMNQVEEPMKPFDVDPAPACGRGSTESASVAHTGAS